MSLRFLVVGGSAEICRPRGPNGVELNRKALAMTSIEYQDRSVCHATAMRKAARKLTLLYDNALASSGLTVNQYSLLVETMRHRTRALTVTELAQAMVMDRSGLLHTLKPLVRDGYLRLVVNPADGRSRQIVPTSKGKDLQKKASQAWSRAQKQFRDSFGSTEAEKLQATLLSIAHDDRLASVD